MMRVFVLKYRSHSNPEDVRYLSVETTKSPDQSETGSKTSASRIDKVVSL